MIRDITIGQFYNVDSIIHRLDPRVKITFTLIYVIVLFMARSPLLYGLAFLVLMLYIILAKVPLRFILKGLKALWFMILLTMVVTLFAVKGADILFQWKFIAITSTGVHSAVYLGLRLVFLIIGSSMMTYTTTPKALTEGLEHMMGWMKKLHVPVYELAMIMSIALRFVPILIEELDKIMKAQMARGVDFAEGNIFVRLKKLLPILIPLFVSSVKRSDDLALAMDARCYHGGEGRTKMKPLCYQRRDYLAYLLLLIYVVGSIVLVVKF